MISLPAVVGVVIYLLIAAAVFGLLYFLIHFVAGKFPGEASAMFVKCADIVLVVCAVLVLLGILLSLAGVHVFA
jgi:hypothetical protein